MEPPAVARVWARARMLEHPTAPWQVFRRWQWWTAAGALLLVPALTARFWLAGDSGWGRAGLMVAFELLPWVVVLPLPLWLAWRFPLTSGTRWRHGGIHVAACLAFASLLPLSGAGLTRVLSIELRGPGGPPPSEQRAWRPPPPNEPGRRPPPQRPSFWQLLLFRAPWNIAAYGLIVAIAHNWRAAQREHERAAQAAELERLLTEARLTNLSRQLQPHFLFNTLNTIVGLVRRDALQAENMLLDLSELLRRTLEAGDRQTVSLAEELALLDLYIDLQRGRFGPRVRVDRHIDPEALAARVPALLLQPLVENSFRHGIEGTDQVVTLTLKARRVGDRVHLAVIDDAPLRTAPANGVGPRRASVGLANTHSRLAALHGPAIQFSAQPGATAGFVVECAFPFEPAASFITTST